MLKKLTVITPTIRGREHLLDECIKSVSAQTVGQVSHKVGIDGDLIGPAKVRNELVKDCDTEWVLFLDDDDLLHEDYLETVFPELTDDRDIVYTWCVEQGFRAGLDMAFSRARLRLGNYIPVTACVRREKFIEVGGFPEDKTFEDYALWLNFLDSGATFHCIHQKKWTYRLHANSRTHENNELAARGEAIIH